MGPAAEGVSPAVGPCRGSQPIAGQAAVPPPVLVGPPLPVPLVVWNIPAGVSSGERALPMPVVSAGAAPPAPLESVVGSSAGVGVPSCTCVPWHRPFPLCRCETPRVSPCMLPPPLRWWRWRDVQLCRLGWLETGSHRWWEVLRRWGGPRMADVLRVCRRIHPRSCPVCHRHVVLRRHSTGAW